MEHRFLTGLLVVLMLAGCGKKNANNENVEGYQLLTVTADSITLQQEYTARLQGQQVVEVRPQVEGLITQICFAEGDRVRKGQVLFIIEQETYQAALDEAEANVRSAEAALSTARLTLQNTQMLHGKGIVSDFALQTAQNEEKSAQAALAQARAKVRSARKELEDTEVRSPVDGVASMIGYRVGALVSSSISTPLVTVSDDRQIYAYFSLTESQIIDLTERYGSLDEFLRQMSAVSLRMSNGKTYPKTGHISAVSGVIGQNTGAVTLRADFPGEGGLLRDGGSATILLPETRSHCIVIPVGATYELQNRTYVFRVVDGKATSTAVNIAKVSLGNRCVVESGLNIGDVIISEGAGLVREGATVSQQPRKEE